MYINPDLHNQQKNQLTELLRRQSGNFAWNYNNMREINHETCSNHIYTQDKIRPVRKPQRQMNPVIKDIGKEELEKLLKVIFIHPISDSKQA